MPGYQDSYAILVANPRLDVLDCDTRALEERPSRIAIWVLDGKDAAKRLVDGLRVRWGSMDFQIDHLARYSRPKLTALAMMQRRVLRGYYGDAYKRAAEAAYQLMEHLAPDSPPGGGSGSAGAVEEDGRLPGEMTLAEAAEKWDIPKSVWSKAAKKPPKEFGHLPSRKIGRHRFFVRKDADDFAKNHLAKREQRAVGTGSGDPGC